MPCPFPGMDPYIEGQIWTDFHTEALTSIRESLNSHLGPEYVALIEERVYVERYPAIDPRWIYPDVTLIDSGGQISNYGSGSTVDTAVLAPVSVLLPMPEEVHEVYLELRKRNSGEVVTVLELLSPTNKRVGSDGRAEYLAKRAAVLSSRTHLVELDLLRGGERLPMGEPMPAGDYFALVSRVERRPRSDVWPIRLRDTLPTIFVPTSTGDPDIPLDLQEVFQRVYQRSRYAYALHYDDVVQPPLADDDAAWVAERLAALRK